MTIVERGRAIGERTISEESGSEESLRDENSIQKTSSASPKIHAAHRAKLALVYVRQSSPQQVLHHRESRERQYALVSRAVELGWPRARVLVIDEDQGRSAKTAEHRTGFHRLLNEVTMDHVGLVLGLEMSRLARSNKDWHHLLELCAIFGVILADEDAIYDMNDSNDRLLLGLKGTISEFELVTMRNRLQRGKLNKAQRGELFHGAPLGYVILPNDRIAFDPDEQAQAVVRLIFAKFEELGSTYATFHYLVKHDIRLPIRPRGGSTRGELEWRRPSQVTLSEMLRHPLYAGAYAYGRRRADPKRKASGAVKCSQWRPMQDWTVLLKDRCPAYITWDQYLRNRERLAQNRFGAQSPGTPRAGRALLPGLVVCGQCGRRMTVQYQNHLQARYHCNYYYADGAPEPCPGLCARALDELLSRQVVRALEPASVELSLAAQADLQRERERLHKHWDQTLRRARYDADMAERRYRSVDSTNRLVAATLEQGWEEALRRQRQAQDEYDRFQRQAPRELSSDECQQIGAAAADVAALWSSASTSNLDRTAIVRCLVERVVVHVHKDDEHVDATIHWAGGYTSQHELVRPVATYAQMGDFPGLMKRIGELRKDDHSARRIAKQLNADGFRRPCRNGGFSVRAVQLLLRRLGPTDDERTSDEAIGPHEWRLADLAGHLQTASAKLMDWAKRGWVASRQTPIQRRWILWADEDEIARLRRLLQHSRRGVTRYPPELTTSKSHPQNSNQ